MSDDWRLQTDDEVTVDLSQCSVSIDHVSSNRSLQGTAVLSIVKPPVVAQLIDLAAADCLRLADALRAFADKLDRPVAAEAATDWEKERFSQGGEVMLVLSRHVDEQIVIGDDVVITVCEIRGDKVRIGIEAPLDVSVHRREV